MVQSVISTAAPLTMLVVFKIMSASDVPQVPSTWAVPPDDFARNHAAVPVALAEASPVIGSAVAIAPGLASAAAPNAGLSRVRTASRVAPPMPASGLVGCEPE